MSKNIKTKIILNYNNESLDKVDFIKEIAPFLSKKLDGSISSEKIIKAINEREEMITTGLGKGLAIPHGQIAGLKNPYLFFIRLLNPIDWKAIDNELVENVFVIFVSDNDKTNDYLKLVSKLANNLREKSFQEMIINESDEKKLNKVIIKLLKD